MINALQQIYIASYNKLCTTLCGRIKGKSRDTNVMYPRRRDTNDLYPGKWCHSLYRHNKSTIDCGFEFVDDIESINLNLVTMVCSRSPGPSFSLNNFRCMHLVATNYISLWGPLGAGVVGVGGALVRLWAVGWARAGCGCLPAGGPLLIVGLHLLIILSIWI